jgi:Tol biopolymer transport system component
LAIVFAASAVVALSVQTVSRAMAAIPVQSAAFFDSEPGDGLGQGRQIDFTTVTFNPFGGGARGYPTFIVSNGEGDSFQILFAGPGDSTTIAPGVYEQAERFAFRDAGHPGLDVFGDGVGCNTLAGRFVVDDATYDDTGKPLTFSARFEVHCDGEDGALFGALSYNSTADYRTRSISPGTLAFNTLSGSTTSKSVTITNNGPSSLSPSGFAISGADANEFNITASTCTSVLAASASCTVTVTYSPTVPGAAHALLSFYDELAPQGTAGEPAGTGTGRDIPLNGVAQFPGLVYVTANSSGRTVHSLALQSRASLPIASGFGCPYEPRLSPPGDVLVFAEYAVADCSGTNALMISRASAAVSTLVTAPANAFIEDPNVSPDDTTVLYSLIQFDARGNFVSCQLYTIPVTGGTPTAISGGGVQGCDGVYSPDGSRIAYAPDNGNYLATMNPDGTAITVLTKTAQPSGFSPGLPAWSPDGTKISYAYVKAVYPATGNVTFGIGLATANNTANRALPVTAAAAMSTNLSSWSADGTEIYYDSWAVNPSNGDETTYGSIYATDATGRWRTTVLATTGQAGDIEPQFVGGTVPVGLASTFTPATPVRLVDTRTGGHQALGAGRTLDLQVAGGSTPVPADATAVVVNVTGVAATANTYLQVYPTPAAGSAVPLVSNLNLAPGQTAAAAVTVTVGASGHIRIRNAAGTTNVIVDLSGYFTAGTSGDRYTPLPSPVRIVSQLTLSPTAETHTVQVSGLQGVPDGATAVVANLTGYGPTAATYLQVYPTGTSPTVSSVNFVPGQTRANQVTVALSPSGSFTVANANARIGVDIDLEGYYAPGATGLQFYPLTPTRVLDTRAGTNTPGGATTPIGPSATLDTPLTGTITTTSGIVTVPATAQVVVANITAVAPTASTYLTAYPTPASGNARPGTSTVNAAAGTVVPNLAQIPLGSNGELRLFNAAGTCPAIIDLAGYYGP